MIHGDGEPLLICYEDENTKFCYAVMKKDIADCDLFKDILSSNTYYDLETPYGYGGALCDGDIPKISQAEFAKEIEEYCKNNKIVSLFVRFHPLLKNYDKLDFAVEKRYMRDTIYIDTYSPELIKSNMYSSKNRTIRKAKKNNVNIVVKPITEYKDFLDMYLEVMKDHNADDYYIFHEDYFESLKELKDNACIFYAMLNEIPISAAIMYYNDKFMHHHLSGTHLDYRGYGAGDLLFYEAACWASERGIKMFHLGGGMSPDDSLFEYKKRFNKNGRLPFYIGRAIYDKDAYNYLLKLRKKSNPEFDADNGYMIQYRKP